MFYNYWVAQTVFCSETVFSLAFIFFSLLRLEYYIFYFFLFFFVLFQKGDIEMFTLKIGIYIYISQTTENASKRSYKKFFSHFLLHISLYLPKLHVYTLRFHFHKFLYNLFEMTRNQRSQNELTDVLAEIPTKLIINSADRGNQQTQELLPKISEELKEKEVRQNGINTVLLEAITEKSKKSQTQFVKV